MRFVWDTALKDLRRHRRDPVGMALWTGIPLVVGSLIILAIGGRSGPSPQAHLLVSDQDNSVLSKMLVGALSQDATGEFVRAEEVSLEDGQSRMDKGDATALLVIPDGFERAVLMEEPSTIGLVTNPAQTILPGIVEEGLSILVDGIFYMHRLVGEDLRELATGPPEGMQFFTDARIAEFSVKIKAIMESLTSYISPPLIDMESNAGEDEEPEDSGRMAVFFLTGILFMALLFMAQGLSGDLWEEIETKTLRRVLASPMSLRAFLTGKTLASLLLMLAVCLLTLGPGYVYLSIDLATLPLATAWSAFSGIILMSILLLVHLSGRNRRGGNILSMVLIFPLML